MESYWDYCDEGPKVVLSQWALHTNATPYTAPEAVCEWYSGRVYGHPHFEDGSIVTTTAVCERDGDTVRTRNTTYRLGDPIAEAR